MCWFFKKKVDIKSIKSFDFTYVNGSFCNSDEKYGVYRDADGNYVGYIKPKLKDDAQKVTFAVEEGFVQGLITLLTENKVGSWNGFAKSNNRVCDGKSFNLRLETEDGEKLKANGYMHWPKNFMPVRDGIVKLFEEAYNG